MEWNPPKFKVLDKINRKQFIKTYKKELGLGLPHLKTFISALKLTWIRKIHKNDTNHKWENTALVKYPLIKNKERYGPRVTNTYSEYNAFWTQVFKAYDEFYNKIKLTNAGEAVSEPTCFNQRIRVGNTFLMHKHLIIVLHTF